MRTDYVSAHATYQKAYSEIVSVEDFDEEKRLVIEEWIQSQNEPGTEVDADQALAIGDLSGTTLVTARAGSGKTTTLVNRALFLQQRCGIQPEEILILAFNRKAVLEIKQRLVTRTHRQVERYLKLLKSKRRTLFRADQITADNQDIDAAAAKFNISLPHVLTFHSLAYALVHPEQSVLVDGDSDQAQSRAVQRIIDDHLQQPFWRGQIREAMLSHFRESWDLIIEGGYLKDQEDLLAYRRSLPRVSMKGEAAKSHGEKIIADFLFEHDVNYTYERNFMWNGINYRPDFTIFNNDGKDLVIEYFGMEGDLEYDQMSNAKREFWKSRPEFNFAELAPTTLRVEGVDGFRRQLKSVLNSHGVKCERLSEDQIWERIRDRAIDRFSESVKQFIGRARKKGLTSNQLSSQILSHSPLAEAEKRYLDVAGQIYKSYLEFLNATGEDDFDGLMLNASKQVLEGKLTFERRKRHGNLGALQHILIDEYQDFSEPFLRLVKAIKDQKQAASLFLVGDDWQAINGFAGSELRFFLNADQYFERTNRLNVVTNYRSQENIVRAANRIMSGLGTPGLARKNASELIGIADLSTFTPTPLEYERHQRDIRTAMVLRMVSKFLRTNQNIVLLCRRGFVPRFGNPTGGKSTLESYLDFLRSHFPERQRNRISISTVHGYKGLESDNVIVLDAYSSSYPLIHPDWIFGRIFGDDLESVIDEERRLFYVALTRAESGLMFVCESQDMSPFVSELINTSYVTSANWVNFPAFKYEDGSIGIFIGPQMASDRSVTYELREELKASGYRWTTTGWQSWFKSKQSTEFDIEKIKAEPWVDRAVGVELRVVDGNEKIIEVHHIDEGSWVQIR
ncbi:UvrD-helicase domain-containing protein [Candidatus Lucifugimonas marina]|uniref:UvrD-helicase domain-containing protein n=1 Tax=Candidatus Lucifugimonas marina TaxID=3038979 RepID=UPI00319DD428